MARASPKHSVHVSNRTLVWQHCTRRFAALINTKALNTNCMPGLSGPSGASGASGPSGPSGGNAARAKKAKATEAEGSAAAAALKVVKAQAKADAAAC